MLSDEEKKAIGQLNKRYEFFKENPLATNVWLSLDVYNLGTILNLIEKQYKEIEKWKTYCDEQENDITLKNNKICDLEFKIEKQSKEIEELKEKNKLLQENYSSAHKDINWFCENYINKDKLKEMLSGYKKSLKDVKEAISILKSNLLIVADEKNKKEIDKELKFREEDKISKIAIINLLEDLLGEE